MFTGGTISMVVDPVAGGAVPALDGAAILARTPGLDRIADVVAIDRGRKPASHWTFAELLELVTTVRELAADPTVDGVVFVQGTDTIEETSFLLDLLVDTAKPIVVTGAMRNASEPDYDGPANLRDAVAVAATAELAGSGSSSAWRARSSRPTTSPRRTPAPWTRSAASTSAGSDGSTTGGWSSSGRAVRAGRCSRPSASADRSRS